MGCRFKDWIYLVSILLVGTGVWYTYSSRPGKELSEPWPWAEDAVDTSRDLLHHPDDTHEYYSDGLEDDGRRGFHVDDDDDDDDDEDDDEDDDDDDDGRLVEDTESTGPFKDYDFDGSNMAADTDGKSPHLQEDKGHIPHNMDADEFKVQYNEQLIDLEQPESDDDDFMDHDLEQLDDGDDLDEESPFDRAPHIDNRPQEIDYTEDNAGSDTVDNAVNQGMAPVGNPYQQSSHDAVETPVYDAANQILQNHAEKAQQLGIVPGSDSGVNIDQTESTDNHLSVVETYKPRIVLRSIVKRERDANYEEPKIPRIIHQSWNTADIPVSFVPWIQSWLQNNPGWEYWFWTNDDVNALIRTSYPSFRSTFESDKLSLMDRANMMRLFIIHAHGGVYAELDMECLKSMDSWIFSHGCFLVEEAREHSYLVHSRPEGNVINAMMACKSHHPLFEVILRALPDYLIRYVGHPAHASGSFFLDDIYKAFKKHPLPPSLASYGDVAMIEPDYFIPSYDDRHWQAIDKACNTNIGGMPFHVSWLCTLWIRKRMHENEPYKHSYTDHHWIDPAELGEGNVATVSILAVIQNVIPQTEIAETQQLPEGQDVPLVPQGYPQQQSEQVLPQQQNIAAMPQEYNQPQNIPAMPQDYNQQNIPAMPQNAMPQEYNQQQNIAAMPQEYNQPQNIPAMPQNAMPQDYNQQEQQSIPAMPQEYNQQQQNIPAMPQEYNQQQQNIPAMPQNAMPQDYNQQQQQQNIPAMPQDYNQPQYEQAIQSQHLPLMSQDYNQQQQGQVLPEQPNINPQEYLQQQEPQNIPVMPLDSSQSLSQLILPQQSQNIPLMPQDFPQQQILPQQPQNAPLTSGEQYSNPLEPVSELAQELPQQMPAEPKTNTASDSTNSEIQSRTGDYNALPMFPVIQQNQPSYNNVPSNPAPVYNNAVLPLSDNNQIRSDYPSSLGNPEASSYDASKDIRGEMLPSGSDKTGYVAPAVQYDANSILQNAINHAQPPAVKSAQVNLYDVLKQGATGYERSGQYIPQNESPQGSNPYGSQHADTPTNSQYTVNNNQPADLPQHEYGTQDTNNLIPQ